MRALIYHLRKCTVAELNDASRLGVVIYFEPVAGSFGPDAVVQVVALNFRFATFAVVHSRTRALPLSSLRSHSRMTALSLI